MIRHQGIVYVPMALAIPILYTMEQVTKIYSQFAHPSPEKLYQLLRRARRKYTTPEKLAVLEGIAKKCDPC